MHSKVFYLLYKKIENIQKEFQKINGKISGKIQKIPAKIKMSKIRRKTINQTLLLANIIKNLLLIVDCSLII